ncbi:MAG: urease accessory protein UreF [Alphaproteobacteria bacterium]|nr:urease accessory protein UreF [Alphaproteobacteria bacterium]
MTITTEAALYRLMTWLSPAYPVGAFSYSHGLEYAVEAGRVCDASTLTEWIGSVLEYGAGRVDGALLAKAWHATTDGNEARLHELVELAAAWRGTAEMALESAAQGAAFLAITCKAWPHPRLDALIEATKGEVALSVAVGAAAALHGIPLAPVLTAYLQAFAANLVSAGVRLVPLGQTDGQRITAALEPVVARAALAAMAADLDDLGTAAPLLDWCSMKHETQYTRLFRS